MIYLRLASFLVGLCFAASALAESGIASVYNSGEHTASGEQSNSSAFAAAHRTLPFGTVVQVINTNNGRIITVRINDRGPFTRGRVIDLTRDEANQLGFTNLAPVVLTVIPMLIDPGLPVRLRCCKGRAPTTP